jgi:hypothetical protein
MKHLRRYNENLTDDEVEELKDFCESSLAYLLDDGYDVYIQREWNVGFHVIFCKPGTEDSEDFYWNDIKDYYIPFLQLLSRRYKLGTYSVNGKSGNVFFNSDNTSYCTLQQVIDDDLPAIVHDGIWGINVKVIGKK